MKKAINSKPNISSEVDKEVLQIAKKNEADVINSSKVTNKEKSVAKNKSVKDNLKGANVQKKPLKLNKHKICA